MIFIIGNYITEHKRKLVEFGRMGFLVRSLHAKSLLIFLLLLNRRILVGSDCDELVFASLSGTT